MTLHKEVAIALPLPTPSVFAFGYNSTELRREYLTCLRLPLLLLFYGSIDLAEGY